MMYNVHCTPIIIHVALYSLHRILYTTLVRFYVDSPRPKVADNLARSVVSKIKSFAKRLYDWMDMIVDRDERTT